MVGINNCFAVTGEVINNYNFGSFTQNNRQASFVMNTTGGISSLSNLTQSGNATAGSILISSNQNGDGVTFSSTSNVVELDGCTITFSNKEPSISNFTLNPGQGKTREVSFGVTVSIDGFCSQGSYNVSGVQIDASGSKTGASTTLIPFQITFNEHVDIVETQVMSFGRIFPSDTGGGQVVIYPNGDYNSNGVHMLDSSTLRVGTFTIGGITNREVQLTFSDAVLSNGTSSMIVSNINADVGTNFVVDRENMPINVGGTLTIGANQPAGSYQGTYTISLVY